MVTNKYITGSAHVAVIATLVVVIIGLLGVVFWQNFIQKKPAPAASVTTSAAAGATQAAPSATTNKAQPVKPADTTNYVVLSNWNVKFAAPTDGSTISWAASTSDSNTIGFSTSNLKTGQLCNAENGAAGSLLRSASAISAQTTGTTMTILNNGQPINGYYYAFEMPNGSHCSDTNPTDYDEALRVQGLVKTLVGA